MVKKFREQFLGRKFATVTLEMLERDTSFHCHV